MGWVDLTDNQKDEFYKRYKAKEDIQGIANQVGGKVSSVERQLRRWGAYRRSEDFTAAVPASNIKATAAEVKDRSLPTAEELFALLKARPYTIDELSRKYDRSNATILGLVEQAKQAGYVISADNGQVSFQTGVKPKAEIKQLPTLADEMGQCFSFASCSDAHCGSAFAQPTARAKFLQIAYEEYGVRHVFDPGDKTAGVNGYRGQEHDLIPALRAYGPKQTGKVTEGEIWLADQYTPHFPGLTYFLLGGNHDYWHVVNSGIDAIYKICEQRDDFVYLGYDVADIPLTDRVDVRLWHPSGGVPYAMSYRLQKALEQTAFEELTRAVTENDNPRLRILLAGHMHIEVKFSRGPMMACHVGCFEGQTNYLKRKGLFPQIGGSIFKVWVTDRGLLQRVEYTFIPFNEIIDDWKNWPVPTVEGVLQEPDQIGVLFRAEEIGEMYSRDGRAA